MNVIGMSGRGFALWISMLATLASTGGSSMAADTVREVADGHFAHVGRHEDMSIANGGDIAVAGFVIGRDAVAVIDPGGGSEGARRLERALRERTALPVTHVVLTHFHPDHVFGAHVFAAPGDGREVTVVGHVNHARAAVQRGAFYRERYAGLLDPSAALVAPTLGVAPGEPLSIDLGGRRLVVEAYPTAHTDNDVSVFDAADGGTLWTGDLVVAGRTPSLDGRLAGWLDVLATLAERDVRTIVPGHGQPGSPAATIGPTRRYLEALLADTRERLDAGDGLADALTRAERASPGAWRLFELHHPTNVTRAWTELEWE